MPPPVMRFQRPVVTFATAIVVAASSSLSTLVWCQTKVPWPPSIAVVLPPSVKAAGPVLPAMSPRVRRASASVPMA